MFHDREMLMRLLKASPNGVVSAERNTKKRPNHGRRATQIDCFALSTNRDTLFHMRARLLDQILDNRLLRWRVVCLRFSPLTAILLIARVISRVNRQPEPSAAESDGGKGAKTKKPTLKWKKRKRSR